MQSSALSPNTDAQGWLKGRGGLWQFLAPGAILCVPLLTYAVFLRYPLLTPSFLLAVSALLLVGAAVGLVILLRFRVLAPLLLPLLIFLAVDLQMGVDGLLALRRGEGLTLFVWLSQWPLIALIIAFSILSLSVLAAGRNAAQVIVVVCAAMMLSTLFFGQRLPATAQPAATAESAFTEGATTRDLPPVVYIVFDEHAGLGGLPPDIPETAAMAEGLAQFYEAAGFRRYDGVLARYGVTLFSISDLLAQRAQSDFGSLADPHRNQHALESNRLFDLLAKRGYRIEVFQSDYFDFCATGGAALATCKVFQRSNVADIRATDLNAFQRAEVLLVTFASRSLTYQTLYRLIMASAAAVPPQKPTRQRFRLGTTPNFGAIPSLTVLDEITANLKNAPRGVLYFAHLLIPHRSYLLDETCAVAWPLSRWHLGFETLAADFNTPESRRAGYAAYSAQMACLYRKLAALMAAVETTPGLEDAIIILQGDHGSRLSLTQNPDFENPDLTPRERLDAFSALFAVRAPVVLPGVDRRRLSLRDVLSETIDKLWPDAPKNDP